MQLSLSRREADDNSGVADEYDLGNAMSDSLEELFAYCRANRRVCPVPMKWNDLYRMLPNARQEGAGWKPALPLILGAGWHASDEEKQQRLAEHLAWASDHGALEKVTAFLRGLSEEEWHHVGE